MFDINENEILAKVNSYVLQRSDILIHINVYEVIAGPTTKKFQAIPTGPNGDAPKENCGFGTTEIDALKDCLAHIKNVDSEMLKTFFIRPLFPK